MLTNQRIVFVTGAIVAGIGIVEVVRWFAHSNAAWYNGPFFVIVGLALIVFSRKSEKLPR